MNKIIDAWGVFRVENGQLIAAPHDSKQECDWACEDYENLVNNSLCSYESRPIRILTDPNLIVIDPNDEAEM